VAFKQLFARKHLAHMQGEESGLRRVLGPVGLTAIGLGAIIGSGIFVTTGRVAAQNAGPGVVLSFVVAGIACGLAGLCYAEFASMAPSAGSAYSYAYASIGEILAWFIGWALVLEYAVAGAVVASGWSDYLNTLLVALSDNENFRVPNWLAMDPVTYAKKHPEGGWSFNLPAALIILVLTAILVRGIKESARTNVALVILKVGIVLFVIVAGLYYVNPANWTAISPEMRLKPEDPAAGWGLLGEFGAHEAFGPADEESRSPFLPFGISGVLVGAAVVFFSYLGFDTVSTTAEEARDPKRDVPLGIIASLVICTVLYIGVAGVLTGMEPYHKIEREAAVAAAFARLGDSEGDFPRIASGIISIGALAGLTSVILATFLGQSRIFLAMSRDGLLPERVFGTIHPRFRTPYISTLLIGVVMAFVAAFVQPTILEDLICIGTLSAFAVVCLAVLVLRVSRPDEPRPFRCPAVWLIAPLGILVNGTMMLFLPPVTWERLGYWLLAGLAIYFGYGFWHSRLREKGVGSLFHTP
jgi:APA family basic amino acid/polyamine antiporter